MLGQNRPGWLRCWQGANCSQTRKALVGNDEGLQEACIAFGLEEAERESGSERAADLEGGGLQPESF